ncbi:MAG TPA: membrane protein insertion efficiency factor YidD [bacterium]|nr:membrane protein insertion efficiency factor YidD [bacterium]
MRKILIFFIRIYQTIISPFLGRNCRFYPNCSEFTIQAIEKCGWKGILIGIKRILRCNAFNEGGYDPIERWIK